MGLAGCAGGLVWQRETGFWHLALEYRRRGSGTASERRLFAVPALDSGLHLGVSGCMMAVPAPEYWCPARPHSATCCRRETNCSCTCTSGKVRKKCAASAHLETPSCTRARHPCVHAHDRAFCRIALCASGASQGHSPPAAVLAAPHSRHIFWRRLGEYSAHFLCPPRAYSPRCGLPYYVLCAPAPARGPGRVLRAPRLREGLSHTLTRTPCSQDAILHVNAADNPQDERLGERRQHWGCVYL